MSIQFKRYLLFICISLIIIIKALGIISDTISGTSSFIGHDAYESIILYSLVGIVVDHIYLSNHEK